TMDILKRTKSAWPSICNAAAEDKNRILSAMADSLQAECDAILRCNAEDMDAARGHISDVMLDRLYLDRGRIDAMADGIRATVALPDHTGRILAQIDHPNGMKIYKKQVPLGLVAIIYESRPNVTSDAAALAIKSGNVCMLRSGKEAFHTAKAIVAALKQGIASVGGDPDIVNIVEDTSHQSATEIMQAKGLVDLLIPRGGAGLIRACVQNATVPCIETGTGICHVYVDKAADLEMAVDIVENAKTSRPSVCNAEEALLVHRDVAAQFLPMLKARLVDARAAAGITPVELHLDARAAAIIDGVPAAPQDFDTEYLDYKLSVAVVDDVDAAIAHIAKHSTHHSEAIVTADAAAAQRFTTCVDSAAVYVNASTRFTDGGEFGLGCEMGISTQKLHARGPMGLAELCTYKYIVHGNGQVRGGSSAKMSCYTNK
uniref:glutamate-5-semialdehyde dehydrogenase n=1 Tax=Gemmiger formicilis TaxID=745368 RepID=UPI003FEFF7CE